MRALRWCMNSSCGSGAARDVCASAPARPQAWTAIAIYIVTSRSNLFEWAVTILGPPDTLYEGGFFNAILKFPADYPQSPPDCRFTSAMWHPNGVCVCVCRESVSSMAAMTGAKACPGAQPGIAC